MIEAKVKEGLDWLDENREAAVEDVKAQQKALEDVLMPLMAKMYAGASAESSTESPGESQPKVDEVD